jgi:uncharacterized membrane protein HdeD (DUF308 family)
MNPNPFSALLHSRKFWLLILDTVISLTLYFVTKYSPAATEDVKFLILALQPVFVTIILAIAWNDNNPTGNGYDRLPPVQ